MLFGQLGEKYQFFCSLTWHFIEDSRIAKPHNDEHSPFRTVDDDYFNYDPFSVLKIAEKGDSG